MANMTVMKGLALTSKGIEDITANEVTGLIGVPVTIADRAVTFPITEPTQLCLLAYRAQSLNSVLLLLGLIPVQKNLPAAIVNLLSIENLPAWLCGKRYTFECQRSGTHDFSSPDIESGVRKEVPAFFAKKYNCIFDYTDPEFIIRIAIIDSVCYVGIDIVGFELHKRHYKIFSHAGSIRATLGYALIRLGGFEKGETLLDPFIGDGVIVIEAALYATNFPLNYYAKDKFLFKSYAIFEKDAKTFLEAADARFALSPTKSTILGYGYLPKYVDNARKNSQIAGVKDALTLSRIDLAWLDVKCKEKSIDRIVTKLPSVKTHAHKMITDFFYQADYILKDRGTVAVLAHEKAPVIDIASHYNFRVSEERTVWSGQLALSLLVFVKEVRKKNQP